MKIEASEDGAALAKEDLKEINRQIRAQKRYDAKVKQDLINQAAVRVSEGLDNNALGVWGAIYSKVGSRYSDEAKALKKKIQEGSVTLAEVKYAIAYELADHTWYEEPKKVIKQLNENLAELGLEPLDISFEVDGGEE